VDNPSWAQIEEDAIHHANQRCLSRGAGRKAHSLALRLTSERNGKRLDLSKTGLFLNWYKPHQGDFSSPNAPRAGRLRVTTSSSPWTATPFTLGPLVAYLQTGTASQSR